MFLYAKITEIGRQKKQNLVGEKGIEIVDEICLKGDKFSSYDMVAEIKRRIPTTYHLIICGDASGNQRNANSDFTNWEIISMGLEGEKDQRGNIINRIYANHIRSYPYKVYGGKMSASNPSVMDRINTVNYHFRKNHITVNEHCKVMIQDLEQVSYNARGDIDKTSNPSLTHMSDGFGYYLCFIFCYLQQTILRLDI